MGELISSGWGWVLLIGGAVILFNLGLIYAILSGSAATQLDMLRKVAQRARHPWRKEDRDLEELRTRMARVQGTGEEAGEDE